MHECYPQKETWMLPINFSTSNFAAFHLKHSNKINNLRHSFKKISIFKSTLKDSHPSHKFERTRQSLSSSVPQSTLHTVTTFHIFFFTETIAFESTHKIHCVPADECRAPSQYHRIFIRADEGTETEGFMIC